MSTRQLYIILSIMVICASLYADNIIVEGVYNVRKQNPKNKNPYVLMTNRYIASINDTEWLIYTTCVGYTNISWPDKKPLIYKKWHKIWSDGNALYQMYPADDNKTKDNNNIKLIIIPHSYYTPQLDYLGMSLPWITYGLTKRVAGPNIPIPWRSPKYNVDAYGFRWEYEFKNRYCNTIKIYRDTSYDKDNITNELLRPQTLYPRSVHEYNSKKMSLKIRKAVDDGYNVTEYRCSEWMNVGSKNIPKVSMLKSKLYGYVKHPYNTLIEHLRATNALISNDNINIKNAYVDLAGKNIIVHDYRYRKLEGKHLYRRAEYTLEPGEPWKGANDPEILAERAEYLESGPEYDDYVTYPHYVSWITMGLIITTPAVIYLIWRRRRRYEYSQSDG
ncbi:MAG: hypothetical protein K9N52_03125 [Verrucomicrobia bacterium]|nr:hypothetical protein [Verrucomicrobiota bacterium]